MATNHEYKLGAALSALSMAGMQIVASAGSTGVLAQTTLLRPPASTQPMGMNNGATNTQASQLGGRTGPVAVTPDRNHPVSDLSTTQPPVPGTHHKGGDAAGDVVIGTQVLKGVSVGKSQKLAAMSAMLLAAAKTETDQIKKANLETAAKAPDMDTGVSLTLTNPTATLGYLTLIGAQIDFSKGIVTISPSDLKPQYGGVAAGVLCDFKRNGKKSGFYLMNFVVEIPPSGGATKMKTLVGATGSTGGHSFSVSPGVQQILVPINLADYAIYVSLASDGPFNFKSCDISTVNSPA